jgi:hypothetical protein
VVPQGRDDYRRSIHEPHTLELTRSIQILCAVCPRRGSCAVLPFGGHRAAFAPQEAAEKVILRSAAPEGAIDFAAIMASLKRCHNTNREFFSRVRGKAHCVPIKCDLSG